MATGNVNVTKAQGAGQSQNGTDFYNAWLMYLAPSEYPVGIIRPYATGLVVTAAQAAAGYYTEYTTDHKVYKLSAGTTSNADPALEANATEVTDAQELAEARTALVTKENMEDLGIVEGGNADKVAYQAKYFFEKYPDGYFWLRVADKGLSTLTFDELDDLVLVTDGYAMRYAVYNNGSDADAATAHWTALQAKYDEYVTAKTPLEICYFPTGIAETAANFIDLKNEGNFYGVSVYNLYDFKTNDADYPAMGAFMGLWSQLKVSESVGHVAKNNFVSSAYGSNLHAEYDSIGLLTSSGIVSWASFKGIKDVLDNKGWNFLLKYERKAGSYVNDMITVSADGNDFEAVYYVLTLDKASVKIRESLVDFINSELIVNSDGTLSDETRHIFINAARGALETMATANELTLAENAIVIPKDQDVATTKELNISANVLLNGIAKTINVKLTRLKTS